MNILAPIIGLGAQPDQPGQGLTANSSNVATLAFGTAGIAATGFLPFRKQRLWDKYIAGVRAVETGFPGAILRTFRASEFLSPLETWSKLSMSPEDMRIGGKYSSLLRNSFGFHAGGVKLSRTGAVFGEVTDDAGKVIGMGLNIQAGTQKGAAIVDYYARLSGIELGQHQSLNDALLRTKWASEGRLQSYEEWLENMEPHLRSQRLIIGAKLRKKINILGKDIDLSEKFSRNLAKAETTTKLFRAKAASTAGRLNTLLTKPLEFLPQAVQDVPFIKSMSVKPGSNLQLLGRFTKKALIAGAAYKGLEYTDYLRSEGSPMAPVLSTLAGAAIGARIAAKPGMKFSKGGLIAGAALGLYAGIAPRFDEGLVYGLASIGTDANIARARISESSGLIESLQRQEEVTPGLNQVSTALGFAGVGGLAVALEDYGKFLTKGLAKSISSRRPVAETLSNLRDANRGKFAEKFFASTIGKPFSKIPLLGKIKSPAAFGAVAGLLAWQGVTSATSLLSGNLLGAIPGSGLFGTTETPEELQDIYSGKQEVAIRKGRWWEFGRSSKYEGGRIDYYRPHFMSRLKTRAYQKGIYGDESEKWEYDPMLHPIKALFGSDDWKYHYEKKHTYDRPAPLTSTYGEEIPFIGPAVAATFGKIFKPRKFIRPEEYMLGEGPGSGVMVHPDIRKETEPSYELGGVGPGSPIMPEDPINIMNDLNYLRREAVGLVGFVEGSMTKGIIGREEFFPNMTTFGTMGKERGSEYWLWKHLNLGGAAGTSEPIRRFIPRTRSYLDKYNPLTNDMPSWMPDDYFLDLKHGNPFDKIAEAEIRLPGAGYEALHPELKGLSAEEYSLAHRVKILGDVAMWSDEYKASTREARAQWKNLSEAEREMVKTTKQQVRSRKKRREFAEYRFNKDLLESQKVTVSEIINPRRFKTKEMGDVILETQGMGAVQDKSAALEFLQQNVLGREIEIFTPKMESRKFSRVVAGTRVKAAPMLDGRDLGSIMAERELVAPKELKDEFEQLRFTKGERLAGAIGEFVQHGIESPIEYLTPMSPSSKLIRKRSAIEEYVASEAIGTSNAFWDKPFENFINPATNMALYDMGKTAIPDSIKERRGIQEYFDMLAWTKASRLQEKAKLEGDEEQIKEYTEAKARTVFGADVFKSPVEIMRALPRRERDFFSSFTQAKTDKDRNKILSLIPKNEQRLYLSQWMRQAESTSRAKRNAKVNDNNDLQTIKIVSAMRKSEGFSYTKTDMDEWYKETNGEQEFDEFIRNKKAEEYFTTHSLPGADWLGWNCAVDLEDVKLQYVEQAGLDHHDYDLWEQRKRALARKPYINEELIREMQQTSSYQDPKTIASNSKSLSKMYSAHHAKITMSHIDAELGEDRYNIEVEDGRRGLIEKAYKSLGA